LEFLINQLDNFHNFTVEVKIYLGGGRIHHKSIV